MVDVAELEIRADSREVRTADRDLDRLSRTSAKTEKSIGTLKSAFAALGGALVLRDMARTINTLEQMRGALLSATGSANAAADAFSKIEQFAKTTPYTLDQSVQGFIKLKNMGLDPSMKALRSYGNTASAMGKQMSQMIEAVADAATGEFERLKEFGIKAKTEGDRVKFTFRGVETEVAKNAQSIEQYLMSIGNVQFGDAMSNQMERIPGLVSNLRDSVDALWRTVGDAGATDVMSDSLRTMISIVRLTSNTISELQEAEQDLASDDSLIDWGESAIKTFAFVADSAAAAEKVISAIFQTIGGAAGAFAAQLAALMDRDLEAVKRIGNEYKEDMKALWSDLLESDFSKFRDNADEMIKQQRELARTATLTAGEVKSTLTFATKEAAVAFKEEQQWIKQASQELGMYVPAADKAARGTGAASKEAEKLADKLEALVHVLDPFQREADELFNTLDTLERAHQAGLIETQEEYDRLRNKAIASMGDAAEATDDTVSRTNELGGAAGQVAQIYEDTASSIRNAFRGAFRDILDGQDSFADRMRDAFKNLLADMATMAITRPIMIPVMQGTGGALGVSGDQQAATAAQLGGAAGAGNWMQSVGPGMAVSAYMAAGYGGYNYGAKNGELSGAKYGGAAGSLQGMVWGGPIGAAIGAAVGTKLSDALGLGGGYTDPGGRIGGGSASGGYGGYMNATGAFGSIGWANGAHHVGGSDKTPAAKAYFKALAELDDAIASFLTEEEVARVKSAMDGWTSSAAGAFNDFGKMSKERLGDIFGAIDGRLGKSMDNFKGSAEESAEYATKLAAAWRQHNEVLKSVEDTITSLNGGTVNVLSRFDKAINESLTAIDKADDFVEQQKLEVQLYDQVMARYQAEQQMLGELHGSISAMSGAIGNIRAAIGADIARITGNPDARSYSEIYNEAGNINKPDVPLLLDNGADSIAKYREEFEQYAEVSSGQIDQLRRLREETLAYYDAQQQLARAMSSASSNIESTLEGLRRGRMSDSQLLDEDLNKFNELMAQAGNASGAELAQIAEQLNALASPLLTEAQSVYASGQGYQDIYDMVTSALSDVQGQLDSTSPQNYEQQSVDLLKLIDGQLATIEQNLATQDSLVVDAIDRSRQETVGMLEHLATVMQADGSHASGLSYVPSDGYRAELHKGEAVIDADTMKGLRKYGISAGGSDPKAAGHLKRIEELLSEGRVVNIKVVQDGKVIKQETLADDINRLSRRGELEVKI